MNIGDKRRAKQIKSDLVDGNLTVPYYRESFCAFLARNNWRLDIP